MNQSAFSTLKNLQYYKFSAYGFLKNLRFYDAFLLLFFLENGLSYAQIGVLYAAREIMTNISEIPSGIIADTYGRKKTLVGAFSFYILSFLTFYVSTNFQLLFMAILLMGIGDAFRSGTHKGMIMDYLKLNDWSQFKIDYYGNTRAWSQRGSAISALFAGILVLYSGSYRIVYLIVLIPYVLNFFNILSYPNELNHSQKARTKYQSRSIIGVFKNFLKAIKSRKVFYVINSSALHSAYLKSIKDYIQPIMVQIAIMLPVMASLDLKRKSGLVIGIIYFIIFILSSEASKRAYQVSNLGFKNISRLTLLTGLLAGVVAGMLFNFEFWVITLIAFIVIYLIENLRKPILTGLLAESVPNEVLTSVISAQNSYATIATSIIAIIFGFFADQFGIGISLLIVSSTLVIYTLIIENFNKKK